MMEKSVTSGMVKERLRNPKIVITRDMERRVSHGSKAEQLQRRLLRTEEKYRSQLLYDQIKAFEDKVYQCYDQFNVDTLLTMFNALSKRQTVGPRQVKSIAKLRQCLRDERKRQSCQKKHLRVDLTAKDESIITYFTWFFEYLRYLRDLRDNFVSRIYNPLFKYFYNIGYKGPDREDSTDSAMTNSTASVLSFRSVDSGVSGLSGLSGLTSVLADAENRVHFGEWDDDVQTARKRIVTRNALLLLSREFRDIKTLYDTSEIEKLAERMCHLKEVMDYLLDNESKVDSSLLSQDSERAVFHLRFQIKGLSTENLMRLIPDILIKCQKAAWIARRWLERDDQTTKDVSERLTKIAALEEQMGKRLSFLTRNIQEKEQELERKADELQKLLQREERSSEINQLLYELNRNTVVTENKFQQLYEEGRKLAEQLTEAVKNNDRQTYKNLKPLYQRNKLQRFALDRQLASLKYQRSVAESDLKVEVDVKPEVIQSTNCMQDQCEELEEKLERAKKEQKAIQAALIPIMEDKQVLEEQLREQQSITPVEDPRTSTVTAEFVCSRASKDTQPMQTENAVYFGSKPSPKAFFITAVPDDISRHSNQSTPIASVRPQKRKIFAELPSEW